MSLYEIGGKEERAKGVSEEKRMGQVASYSMRNTDVTDVIERVTELMHEQTQSQEEGREAENIIRIESAKEGERTGDSSNSRDPLERQK